MENVKFSIELHTALDRHCIMLRLSSACRDCCERNNSHLQKEKNHSKACLCHLLRLTTANAYTFDRSPISNHFTIGISYIHFCFNMRSHFMCSVVHMDLLVHTKVRLSSTKRKENIQVVRCCRSQLVFKTAAYQIK